MKYKFYYPLRVRYVETDAQRHVFFGHYLTYFDVGLTEYMRAIGCHYPDMGYIPKVSVTLGGRLAEAKPGLIKAVTVVLAE